MNKNLFIRALNEQMEINGESQVTLSEKLGIGQSQLSKILSGNFSREGSAIKRLIAYSKYEEYLEKITISDAISKAVLDVWDGSPAMETRIAHTIKEIGAIWTENPFRNNRH